LTFEIPKQVKPVWDFAIQIVVGAVGFIVVLLVAVAIAAVVKWIDRLGVAPPWLFPVSEYVEMAIFGLDLFCFGLFC
jgi:hypothetical protein